jgi:two-component system heavy metal sensor histidine kinase CusS
MKINPQSLHVRLCAWYALMTMLWMSVLGILSYVYLSHALESSRQETLRRREARLIRFVEEERHRNRSLSVPEALHQFTLMNPDTDVLQVVASDGTRIFPQTLGSPMMPWVGTNCEHPCFDVILLDNHHFRTLQHLVTLDGQQLRVQMAGRIDEHYDILRMVRNFYFVLIPIGLIASAAGGLVLSHRALEPVDRMSRAARVISIRDLRNRLPVLHTGDEMQRFAETWNDLLARLEHAVQHLTKFTSDISHDLRTTVTVMLSTAQLALRRERTQAEYRAALQTVVQECEATSLLLDDLLMAARADIAEQNIDWSPVDLSALVEEVCSSLHASSEMKSQQMVANIEHDVWVMGDSSLLRRLTSILLDNAIKYTPEQGAIAVSLSLNHGAVRLEVRDTGVGIAPGEMERIFDRFYRVDTSRNREQGGSGLGLTIAKWIAEAHRTQINVTSGVRSGSIFAIAFPAYQPILEETFA